MCVRKTGSSHTDRVKASSGSAVTCTVWVDTEAQKLNEVVDNVILEAEPPDLDIEIVRGEVTCQTTSYVADRGR